MNANLRARVLVLHNDCLLLHPPEEVEGAWTVPGGGLEIGETLTECAAREVWEETGVRVQVTGVAFLRERPWLSHESARWGLALEVYFFAEPVTERIDLRPETADAPFPRWVPVREAAVLPLRPAGLQSVVETLAVGAPQSVPCLNSTEGRLTRSLL